MRIMGKIRLIIWLAVLAFCAAIGFIFVFPAGHLPYAPEKHMAMRAMESAIEMVSIFMQSKRRVPRTRMESVGGMDPSLQNLVRICRVDDCHVSVQASADFNNPKMTFVSEIHLENERIVASEPKLAIFCKAWSVVRKLEALK